jgi:nucleoid DNA-binding protein
MRRRQWWALGALLGTLGLVLGLTGMAYSQRPAQKPQQKGEETLNQRLARESRLTEEQANRFMNALGPAIRDQIKNGKQVNVPGLGTFRVVRVPEHRDLQNGRPATVAGSNTVEFLPSGDLASASNAPGAKPAETVPPFEYTPLPGRTPGQKAPPSRSPTTRTR